MNRFFASPGIYKLSGCLRGEKEISVHPALSFLVSSSSPMNRYGCSHIRLTECYPQGSCTEA